MPRSRSRSRDRSRRDSPRDRTRDRRDRRSRDKGRERDRRERRSHGRSRRSDHRSRRRHRRRSRSPSSSSSSSSSDEGDASKGKSSAAPGSLLWKPASGDASVGPTGLLSPSLVQQVPQLNSVNMALMQAAGLSTAGMPMMTGTMAMQQDKKQCELYVGNLLTGHVNGAMLAQCFTQMFKGVPGFDASRGPAVKNVQLSGNNFGFVEFRDAQVAATAMKFAGAQLLGRPLKIGRPSGYVPAMNAPMPLEVPNTLLASLGCNTTFQINAGIAGAGMIDDKKQREVWVGNLAKNEVNNEMMKKLFETMLMGMENTPPNPVVNVQVGANGMYAFVELATQDLATMCIQVFNGIELRGRAMKVGRPTGYIDPSGPMAQMQNNLAMGGMTTLAALGLKPAPPPPPPAGAAPVPAVSAGAMDATGGPTTNFVRLENFASEQELKDDEEYKSIKEDIHEECQKHGPIKRFEIPRPTDPDVDPSTVGKAFMEFETDSAARAVVAVLNGRAFGPLVVKATLIPGTEFPKSKTP